MSSRDDLKDIELTSKLDEVELSQPRSPEETEHDKYKIIEPNQEPDPTYIL